MNKPTFTTTIASPTDVKLPMWAYAIMIGASITAGSSVAMTRLGIPLWGWALEFVIMTLVAYFLVRNNAIEKSDSEKGNPTYVVANRSKSHHFRHRHGDPHHRGSSLCFLLTAPS